MEELEYLPITLGLGFKLNLENFHLLIIGDEFLHNLLMELRDTLLPGIIELVLEGIREVNGLAIIGVIPFVHGVVVISYHCHKQFGIIPGGGYLSAELRVVLTDDQGFSFEEIDIGLVNELHDFHLWTITSGIYALSGHLVIEDQMVSKSDQILKDANAVLQEKFGITHTTLQMECSACGQYPVCHLGE